MINFSQIYPLNEEALDELCSYAFDEQFCSDERPEPNAVVTEHIKAIMKNGYTYDQAIRSITINAITL